MLKDTRLEGEIESVRFLAPQVAVAHWTGSVAYLWQQQVPRRRQSRQTLVAVRRDGRWQATATPTMSARPRIASGGGDEVGR